MITCYSGFRYVNLFRIYLRLKSKVVRNLPKFVGSTFSKSCTHVITAASRHVSW